MGKFLGRKPKPGSNPASEDTKYVNYDDTSEFQKHDLYQKGVNQMASEKLEDAIRSFELALRIDPKYVDSWIKKGYAHFHLGQYPVAISSYNKAIDIDLNNGEAWNLKGLAYYRMNNYEKAVEACEKAIDINPNDGMSWYNKACYLTVVGKVEEGMDIEVVVLESIRQGYNHVGKIVWVTGMDRLEVEEAFMRLSMKGLTVKKQRKEIHGFFTSKEEYYELVKEIADKVGVSKRVGLFGYSKEVSAPVQQLRDIIEIIGRAKESVEKGDVNVTIECFDQLINPTKHGTAMIEEFFDEHRDLRLFQIRLKDKGNEYLNSHKPDLIKLLTDIETKMRTGPVSRSTYD